MREGNDAAILANGPLVAEAVEAADQLQGAGVAVRVLDMHTVKPIDRAAVLDCAASVRLIVTAEEHNIHGGMGSAVLEVLGEERSCPVVRIGIPDIFPIIAGRALESHSRGRGFDPHRLHQFFRHLRSSLGETIRKMSVFCPCSII